MKEIHLFFTEPYWRSSNFSKFWLLNCPVSLKCDLTLTGPNHHSSQKTSCWQNSNTEDCMNIPLFYWSGVFITQKGVEMLSTAFFKSRYNIMTAQNNSKSRALSSVIIISISADLYNNGSQKPFHFHVGWKILW